MPPKTQFRSAFGLFGGDFDGLSPAESPSQRHKRVEDQLGVLAPFRHLFAHQAAARPGDGLRGRPRPDFYRRPPRPDAEFSFISVQVTFGGVRLASTDAESLGRSLAAAGLQTTRTNARLLFRRRLLRQQVFL